jgi:hypothetical protein
VPKGEATDEILARIEIVASEQACDEAAEIEYYKRCRSQIIQMAARKLQAFTRRVLTRMACKRLILARVEIVAADQACDEAAEIEYYKRCRSQIIQMAARKLQALTRRMLTRMACKRLILARVEIEYYKRCRSQIIPMAAGKLQAFTRRMLTRMACKREKRTAAAITIQLLCRMRLARQVFIQLLKDELSLTERHDAMTRTTANVAITIPSKSKPLGYPDLAVIYTKAAAITALSYFNKTTAELAGKLTNAYTYPHIYTHIYINT